MNTLKIKNLPYLERVSISGGKGTLEGFKLAEALGDISNGVGNLSAQMGADPNGSVVMPPKIARLQGVHLGNGILNFAITDNGPVKRAVDYIVELANNASFSGSEVVHFSPSRNGRTVVPNGVWYLKAYSQYRYGGNPSEALTAGPLIVTGSVNAKLLGTQGCGAANPGDTGKGAGMAISR